VEASPGLVSQVTETVCADVKVWQQRLLEEVYPIVYFDALWGKVRTNGPVVKVAVYLALGITTNAVESLNRSLPRHPIREFDGKTVECLAPVVNIALMRLKNVWAKTCSQNLAPSLAAGAALRGFDRSLL
jgi:mutator family transposase